MAANDWADRELDARERPERPLPSGRVSPAQALAVAVGLTAAGLGLAALAGGRRATAVALPLAGAVWAYDLRAKNTAAGPLGMAACRALDVLLGAVPGRPARALPAALAVAVHTYTVTTLSRREVSGARPGLAAATMAVTAVLSAAVAGARRARESPPGGRAAGIAVTGALAGGYALRYGRAQARVLRDPAAPRVRAAVGAGITALPALQGALAAREGALWAGVGVAAAAPVAKLLTRKVSAT
jgi:4-hydroxybenzoate polyprenyltransferase